MIIVINIIIVISIIIIIRTSAPCASTGGASSRALPSIESDLFRKQLASDESNAD